MLDLAEIIQMLSAKWSDSSSGKADGAKVPLTEAEVRRQIRRCRTGPWLTALSFAGIMVAYILERLAGDGFGVISAIILTVLAGFSGRMWWLLAKVDRHLGEFWQIQLTALTAPKNPTASLPLPAESAPVPKTPEQAR